MTEFRKYARFHQTQADRDNPTHPFIRQWFTLDQSDYPQEFLYQVKSAIEELIRIQRKGENHTGEWKEKITHFRISLSKLISLD